MRSWPPTVVPELPGRAPTLRVFDTASRQIRPTAPGERARMYVCGITPYDATHIGHAATYILFDTVNRIWRDGGHDVDYTQNVTDVDDPLLERAVESGEDWRGLADRETEAFRADMEALRVIPPRNYIGAVESIPWIVDSILELKQMGAAYEVDGDLYFPVGVAPRFGEVSGLSRREMMRLFAERGGDPQREGKRDPLDALLWRSARDGEPSWSSALGRGRPGWHVECSSIASVMPGVPLDIQGGGSDLSFPHHEMCAAMAEAGSGKWPFARHYLHVGMVGYQGEKMSKSRGNLVFVRSLLDGGADPSAIRLAILAHHYQTDWEWTPEDLARAQDRLTAWRLGAAARKAPSGDRLLQRLRECLSDNLSTDSALAAVDDWATQARLGRGPDADAPTLVRAAVDALLGVVI
ncbi:MAG: cysteine--1-D-myo-inosityl 2-amino-2-deoxy-alpha-D-glucopyranoside ligase [Candidatus Nanopelagicales bacterium]|nr:cysteine--1-D-myo-inosityl 2-amino-2-deoxy-alpha-D-glucopyranoside ligase [Candidatus Nanopelagicales bacterium]